METFWDKLRDMAQSAGQSLSEINRIGKRMRNHPDWNKPIWKRDLDDKLFGEDYSTRPKYWFQMGDDIGTDNYGAYK